MAHLKCIDVLDIVWLVVLKKGRMDILVYFIYKNILFNLKGRKLRRLPPVRVFSEEKPPPAPKQKFTFTRKQLSGLYGNAAVDPLVSAFNNVVRF